MARFIVEYDILIGKGTKRFILDEGEPSYTGCDLILYSLTDTIQLLVDGWGSFDSDTYPEDINYLRSLKEDGVNYIEI